MAERIDVRATLEVYFNLGRAVCMKGNRTLSYRMQDMFVDYDCMEASLKRKVVLRNCPTMAF